MNEIHEEEWKKVKGFENYEVSSFGNLRRILKNNIKECNLKMDNLQRFRFKFYNGKKVKTIDIREVVLEAFSSQRPSKEHTFLNIDNDIYNNKISNLRWILKEEKFKLRNELWKDQETVEITHELVTENIDYDPISGNLTWLYREPKYYNDGKAPWVTKEFKANMFNKTYVGKEALNYKSLNRDGSPVEKQGSFFNHQLSAHRLIWFYMTGEWPEIIDHINGDPFDNRWCNLRNTSSLGNSKNAKIGKNNTSGHLGVSFSNTFSKWRAYINLNYKQINLGYFENFEEAVKARKEAEIKYGYHENHGKR